MAKKKKMAIAIFSPRRNVIPTFAALLPQMEERGEAGQLEPPGIHVIPLPYADDIREAPEKHRDQLQGEFFQRVTSQTTSVLMPLAI